MKFTSDSTVHTTSHKLLNPPVPRSLRGEREDRVLWTKMLHYTTSRSHIPFIIIMNDFTDKINASDPSAICHYLGLCR